MASLRAALYPLAHEWPTSRSAAFGGGEDGDGGGGDGGGGDGVGGDSGGGDGGGGDGVGGDGGVNLQMHCLLEEHGPELPVSRT